MSEPYRVSARPLNTAVEQEVLTVAAARAALPATLRRFREDPEAEPVLVGSHRKLDGALVPIRLYRMICAAQDGTALPVLEFLKQRQRLVARLATLSRIETVAVFGSVARREEGPDSDVDFLVQPAHDASLFDLAQFAEDMEGLLARRVDVVSRRSLDEERDRRILAEAVSL